MEDSIHSQEQTKGNVDPMECKDKPGKSSELSVAPPTESKDTENEQELTVEELNEKLKLEIKAIKEDHQVQSMLMQDLKQKNVKLEAERDELQKELKQQQYNEEQVLESNERLKFDVMVLKNDVAKLWSHASSLEQENRKVKALARQESDAQIKKLKQEIKRLSATSRQ